MLPNEQDDLVLRLLDGKSSRNEIVLCAGKALPPFVLGRRGAWSVNAAHVADAHVVLAFNGRSLFVCAFRREVASLDGVALDNRWTEAAVPVELRFGGARVSISRRSEVSVAEAAPPDEATRVADLRPRAAAIAASAVRAPLGEAVTRVAEIDVPAAARGPSSEDITIPPRPAPPMVRPPSRPIRIARKARVAPLALDSRSRTSTEESVPESPIAALTTELLRGLGAPDDGSARRPARRAAAMAPPAPAPHGVRLPGLRDTRTPERRALDTCASGRDAEAAEQYEALALAQPEKLAFREAARILRARSSTHDE